jgi:hypothetical protein
MARVSVARMAAVKLQGWIHAARGMGGSATCHEAEWIQRTKRLTDAFVNRYIKPASFRYVFFL